MAQFMQFEKFDSSAESWEEYEERLESYLVATDTTTEQKKVAILISVMGAPMYTILKSLVAPQRPTGLSFQQLTTHLKDYNLDPQPTQIMQRFKFFSADQENGENIAEYMAKLRKLITKCTFSAESLDERLRDRLVMGIKDQLVQKKLLSESELTLNKAVSIAQTMETTAADAAEIQRKKLHIRKQLDICSQNQLEPLKNVDERFHFTRNIDKLQQNQRTCGRCGRAEHAYQNCAARNITCYNCGRSGHFARLCRSAKKSQDNTQNRRKAPINEVKTEAEETWNHGNISYQKQDTEIPNAEEWELYQLQIKELSNSGLQSPSKCPPWFAPFQINGKWLNMEIDTGAGVSVISEKDYNKLRINRPIRPANIQLRTYTKTIIPVVGKVYIWVRSKLASNPKLCELIIVKGEWSPLVGRPWLNTLPINWQEVVKGSSSPMTGKENIRCIKMQSQVHHLVNEYHDIFAEELGCLKHVSAKLCLKNAKANFFNSRPIPFAMQDKVINALKKEIKEGILKPTSQREWAAPIVPIAKPNGSVRVCGDFKVTVNSQIIIDAHPLPRIEDLLYKLNGGDKFTKLDMSRAYHQIELNAESQNLCVINTPLGLLKYQRLPFGVSSAPAIFQKIMDQTFSVLPGVSCFLDDIVVTEEMTKNTSIT